jgi:hypothetical protein
MVAHGCLVYIYQLSRVHSTDNKEFTPGSLRAVTSILCPRRVLACSMDTSSHRYAIAILMDGRLGLVCDITTTTILPQSSTESSTTRAQAESIKSSPPNILGQNRRGISFLDRATLNSSVSNVAFSTKTDSPFVFPGIATIGASFAPIDSTANHCDFRGRSTKLTETAEPSPSRGSHLQANQPLSSSLLHSLLPAHELKTRGSTMSIETGPRSLYRNICSDDDPPRSVAICPQRRCVALAAPLVLSSIG